MKKAKAMTKEFFTKHDSKDKQKLEDSKDKQKLEDIFEEYVDPASKDDPADEQVGGKKPKLVDPFKVPPNKLTKMTFVLQNPFIDVIDVPAHIFEFEDKVCDGKMMSDGALKEAMREMVYTTKLGSGAFKTPSSEMGGRPYHNLLASAFWLVTRPHQEPEYETYNEFKEARKHKAATSDPAESQHDLKIIQKKAVLIGNESNESLDVRHEGDDGELMEARIRYDLNFVVHDHNIQGPDNQVTTLIVDGTWAKLKLSKMFQVSSYACKYAMKNMAKGRFSPVYVELWGESKWRYGILYPSGVVVVENGKVAATSFKCSSVGELENTLGEKELTLHANFPNFKGCFPDGSYVEGILYLSGEKFTLPNCFDQQLGHIHHAQLFYQSKMRIIAGDTVLQWNEDEVKNRVAFRKRSSEAQIDEAWIPSSKNKSFKRRRK